MKKSDAVRIAEIQCTQELIKATLGNPLISYVLAFTALELLQKNKITGNVETSFAEAGLGAIAGAQALGPSLPGILSIAGKALASGA